MTESEKRETVTYRWPAFCNIWNAHNISGSCSFQCIKICNMQVCTKQCDLCFLSHSEEFAKTQFQSHNLENIQIIVTELEIYI